MKKFKMFAEFTKVEEQEDGTLKVSGIASSEAVDSAGESITADAMKAAIPGYMEFGAVREMHQSWAAGTALKCEVNAEGKTEFEALVVDSEAIKKVQTGTYKGFSVGGKITERDAADKNIIKGIKLIEVSLVDRPANPEAVFSLGKVEGDDAATLGELRKSMWEVKNFVEILQSVGWMAQSIAYEADYEGDNSPIPAALRDWLADGAAIFQAMAAEEIAELLATLPAAPTVEVVAMAEKLAKGETAEDLAKAGARFSKTVKATLAEVHKALKECDGKMATLKYEDAAEEEDQEKAAAAESLQKLAGELEEVKKAASKVLAENEGLSSRVGTLTTEKADLAKRITELEAQPAPPKGALKVISKGDDLGGPEAEDTLKKQAEEIDRLPPHEQAVALVKAVHNSHRTGGQ